MQRDQMCCIMAVIHTFLSQATVSEDRSTCATRPLRGLALPFAGLSSGDLDYTWVYANVLLISMFQHVIQEEPAHQHVPSAGLVLETFV